MRTVVRTPFGDYEPVTCSAMRKAFIQDCGLRTRLFSRDKVDRKNSDTVRLRSLKLDERIHVWCHPHSPEFGPRT